VRNGRPEDVGKSGSGMSMPAILANDVEKPDAD
jgi:hypothetical protein